MKKGVTNAHFEVKSSDTNNTIISGYASVFNFPDHDNDIILKGAFKAYNQGKPKLLWQHDTSKPIGIIISMTEDDYGLKIEAEINNRTTAGREASELIKQRAVDGLSIGFQIKSASYNNDGQRLIEEVELMEISVVTFPANCAAQIQQVKKLAGEEDVNLALKELDTALARLAGVMQG